MKYAPNTPAIAPDAPITGISDWGAIEMVAKAGAGFAGFAAWFDMTPADPDVLVVPDPNTAIPLPWKPGVVWVTGDLFMEGKPVEQNPRQVLKRVIASGAKAGYEMKTGVECEFHLISRLFLRPAPSRGSRHPALVGPDFPFDPVVPRC